MGRLGYLHQQCQRDAEPCGSCTSSPRTWPDVKIRIRRLTISRQPRFDDASLTIVASILDPGSVRVTAPSVVYLPSSVAVRITCFISVAVPAASLSYICSYRYPFGDVRYRTPFCCRRTPSASHSHSSLSLSIRSSCFVDLPPSTSLLYISMYPPAQPKVRRRSVTNMYSYRTY